jgi:ribosomal protein S18 acetylase RimI-like enzyme
MVSIRPLRWTDFAAWTELYFSRWPELDQDPEFGLSVPPTKPSMGEEAAYFGAVQKNILQGDAIFLVAEEEGQMVGGVSVERQGRTADERHVGILGVHVAREWRGKGVGRALIAQALEECRGKFEIVHLTVMSQNERAQRLYLSLGFQETGREPRAFKRGTNYFDKVRMWRPVE